MRQPVLVVLGNAMNRERRGVASVLAMMFLVLFGSLAAAMAVVAQSNLRTADSSLKVSRAMSAAETGLVFGARRLAEQSGRFVVTEGTIDANFADALWRGVLPVDEFDLLPPDGYVEAIDPGGIMEAIEYVHAQVDTHAINVLASDADLPSMDTDYGVLEVKPIPLSVSQDAVYFRLRYELVENEPFVRITSRGYDGDIEREISMDFRIGKKIEFAVLSPNRIMIGKNVMIEGPLGSRYGMVAGELASANGDPVTIRSDFFYLHDDLDDLLTEFFEAVVLHDVDGDGRLRPGHPDEGPAVSANPNFVDHDGDEFVDDFDLFLAFYDADSDGRVVHDPALALGAGHGAVNDEFLNAGDEVDVQLAYLIDEAFPDRDGDGDSGTWNDVQLGYRDGVIDSWDRYAKLTGRLAFAIERSAWEDEHGESYQTVVEGPIRTGIDQAPVAFEVPDEDLLEITTDMFDIGHTWYEDQVPADDSSWVAQVAAGGGMTGEEWESVPYGATGAYDYYKRPVYENMTFTNVRIPMGTNALFRNCTFIGVTYIESETDCDHIDWNYAGALQWEDDGDGVMEDGEFSLRFPDLPPAEAIADGDIIADTRTISNNMRFEDCVFLGTLTGDKIGEYTHWRNKIQMTGETRFYIDPDDEDLVDLVDDGDAEAIAWQAAIEAFDLDDRAELEKSSMLMPGWSMDMGNFTNDVAVDPDDTATVKLKGVIVAGILDVRGTADVFGTLLMTYRPTAGEGPLFYGGQPDAFNTTIGYFGPADGDSEGVDPGDAGFEGFGEIRLRYNPDAILPDGIPWPITVESVEDTYVEGGFS